MKSSPAFQNREALIGRMIQDSQLREALDLLPLGIIVLDHEGRIRAWNAWLSDHTRLDLDRVSGKTLSELFPGFENPRFEWALEQVLEGGLPQILSQSFNRYLIPIKTPETERDGLNFMQQSVQLSPLSEEGALCLVSIIDVSENVLRSSALVKMAKTLQESALHDSLTELYNRRFMWEWLEHEFSQARRYDYSVGCLLLDIDHFKTINDTLGHDAGDRALCDLARLLSAQVRESDVVVRFGGEEFAMLFPHCALSDGVRRAEHIVDTVRQSSLGGLDAGRVTCSVGVAIFDPAYPVTGDELLKQADVRLYEAKQAGRNRVSPNGVTDV
jgi:diguanylate cyclase (GGDEF)-like protein